MHVFFVNLLGSVVVIWSLLRVIHPEPRYGIYDAVCRFMFSIAMAWVLFGGQGTGILWFFLIPEITWGVVQLVGYKRIGQVDAVTLTGSSGSGDMAANG